MLGIIRDLLVRFLAGRKNAGSEHSKKKNKLNLVAKMKPLRCVVAMDVNRGIGKDNELPWKLR